MDSFTRWPVVVHGMIELAAVHTTLSFVIAQVKLLARSSEILEHLAHIIQMTTTKDLCNASFWRFAS
jgi:hypothetical protein